ncbi:hypothetical protein CROQUDRAFT_673362 [Cronartium quercuum f. sp. fusiforme G11]|uniref:Uncharacterized protein n=1 Tax=Cronartium quercuum f. sp. fusiforme G11 TaxID=708437 RepID=A0A9P6NFN8_9BASI|nr:hypothetical protein CROQUDRAFT_673362 [Cronartium quercuum f. sp. fusiforme G11]
MCHIKTWLTVTMLATALKELSATGEPCKESNNRLDPNSHRFLSDCGPIDYCNGTTQTCEPKGCRIDEFPFGYSSDDPLPGLCADGYVCPDEENSCQPLAAVGGPCQLNRDDECAPNPTPSTGSLGLAVCLRYTCIFANISLGQTCLIDNTIYSGYLPDGSLSSDVVMRDNCDDTLYCDPDRLICQKTAADGQACQSDRHCNSSNCALLPPTSTPNSVSTASNQTDLNSSDLFASYIQDGVCVPSPATPVQLSNWVYFFVVMGICLAMFGFVFGLFQLHKAESKSRRELLNQYWDEQLAFRKSIINLHSTVGRRGYSNSERKRYE